MVHTCSRRARVDLHVVSLAALLTVAGYGADGFLSGSAFAPQRCSLRSQQARMPRQKTPSRQLSMTLTPSRELEELPEDQTHSIFGSWREFSFPGSRPSSWKAQTLADFSDKTGGAWKSRYLGMIPINLMAAPFTTTWMKTNEQRDLLTTGWPKSMMKLIGEKSIISADLTADQHGVIRDLFLDAPGPTTILSVQPLLEYHMDRYMKIFEGYANSGEPLKLIPIIKDLTLDVTAASFLGDISQEELVTIRDAFNIMTHASRSIPIELPWPLSHTTLGKNRPFNYGYAMYQRKKAVNVISAIIERRKREFESSENWQSMYVLDKMLEAQARQRERGGPGEGELLIDEVYILDNLMVSFAAGYGPTSAVISRMVQILTTPDTEYLQDAADKIFEEVHKSTLKVGTESAGGLFANFPLLKSLTFEIARLYPPFDGAFRRPVQDLEYNGFKIPKGSNVVWSPVPVSMSEEYYPEPEKVCPFRFVKGKATLPTDRDTTDATRFAEEPGQPLPPMYGFGRHYCPGRELSKMAAVLFLRKFYELFNVNVIETQDFRGDAVHNLPRDGMMLTLSMKTPSTVAAAAAA